MRIWKKLTTCLIFITQKRRDIMAELRDEHFEVISSNRAREYEEKKKTINIIKSLLIRYSKKQLFDMIEKESDNAK